MCLLRVCCRPIYSGRQSFRIIVYIFRCRSGAPDGAIHPEGRRSTRNKSLFLVFCQHPHLILPCGAAVFPTTDFFFGDKTGFGSVRFRSITPFPLVDLFFFFLSSQEFCSLARYLHSLSIPIIDSRQIVSAPGLRTHARTIFL